MNKEAIYSVLAVIVVTVFFSWKAAKNKNEAWEGEVIRKRYSEDDDTGRESFVLVVRTDRGKKRRVSVGRQYYESIEKGDRLVKKAGELVPSKKI